MKVNAHGKEVVIEQQMIERIGTKLSFLDKYVLIEEDTTAQVTAKKHGNDIKLEITIPTKIGIIRSEVIDKDMRNAVDASVDKLEDQLRRQKTRLSRRHKDKLSKSFAAIDNAEIQKVEEKVVRRKRVVAESLDYEEAIIQMELLGHSFFVYRDNDSKLINVIYKREDGGYGLIETV